MRHIITIIILINFILGAYFLSYNTTNNRQSYWEANSLTDYSDLFIYNNEKTHDLYWVKTKDEKLGCQDAGTLTTAISY